jgi:hypothetical protein
MGEIKYSPFVGHSIILLSHEGKNGMRTEKDDPLFGPLLICNDKPTPFSQGPEQVCNYPAASTTCSGPTKT